MLKISLKKGYIGIPDKQRKVLQALGLKKINDVVERKEDKSVSGMLQKVAHLVSVEKTEK